MPQPLAATVVHFTRLLEVTVLVVATLYFGRPILLPLFASILFTFLLSPPMTWLVRRRVPRLAAALGVVTCVIAVVGLVGWSATSQLSQLAVELPRYESNLYAKMRDLRSGVADTFGRVGRPLNQLATQMQEPIETPAAAPAPKGDEPPRPPDPVPVKIVESPANAWETANMAYGLLAAPLATFGMITVFVVFMLMEREDLRDRMLQLAGPGKLSLTTRTFDEIGNRISRYLILNALMNGAFGLVIGVGLYFIDVHFAALWGLLAACLRFIPYVGAYIAAVPPLAVSIAEFPTWMPVIIVVVLFVTVESVVVNFIEPFVYGRSAGVSPLALMVAALFWGWIWGLAGLVLAVPLTVSLAVLGKYLPPLAPLWILLGDDVSLSSALRYYQRLLADDPTEAREVFAEYRRDHSLAETFDDVVLPALARAERDRTQGEISAATHQSICELIEQLVDELPASEGRDPPTEKVSETRLVVATLPALERIDVAALKMLARLAPPDIHFERLSLSPGGGDLRADAPEEADFVLISATGPGGPQLPALCRRVREIFPRVPLLIGRWVYKSDAKQILAATAAQGPTTLFTKLAPTLEMLRQYLRRTPRGRQIASVATHDNS